MILRARKGFVNKLSPNDARRTMLSTVLSSQLAKSDGSSDAVLFRMGKVAVRSGW